MGEKEGIVIHIFPYYFSYLRLSSNLMVGLILYALFPLVVLGPS